jgi:hypothetical protein
MRCNLKGQRLSLVGNQQARCGYAESVAACAALDTEAIEQSPLQTDLDLDSTQRNQLKLWSSISPSKRILPEQLKRVELPETNFLSGLMNIRVRNQTIRTLQ